MPLHLYERPISFCQLKEKSKKGLSFSRFKKSSKSDKESAESNTKKSSRKNKKRQSPRVRPKRK
jgi:hypothetical protein